MRNGYKIGAVIPALNEEASIGRVIGDIPEWVDQIVVADNGSTDGTPEKARDSGAIVVHEPRRGYGAACLKGIARLESPDIIVFLDGDYSDHPEEAPLLVDPIVRGEADFVVGSRLSGDAAPGSLTPQAKFGNWLSCKLMRLLWGVEYTDLGPFRAISAATLAKLDMRDLDYGWTVEMQIKAAILGARSLEVPVSYRPRIGKSKVSGTLRGVVCAGSKILWTIFKAALTWNPASMAVEPRKLIVFTRYPEPGKTKTRMIEALGEVGAAELHRRMTERTLASIRDPDPLRNVAVEIAYEGADEDRMAAWLGKGYLYKPQGPGDLGARMNRAIADSLRVGAEKVVLIGTDCPDRDAKIVRQAFRELDANDLVLGPAVDGGYYLIGMRRIAPEVFAGIPWGTDHALEATVESAAGAGLSVAFVPTLHDVDRPEDLYLWEQIEPGFRDDLAEQAPAAIVPDRTREPDRQVPGRISVIIPTLNEERHIVSTLARVINIPGVEAIVVDGGSVDRTVPMAESMGARVESAPLGRANQMNRGAEIASGEILLFLHADTLLPDGWERPVSEISQWPDTSCAAFQLAFDAQLPGLRTIQRLGNYRSEACQMPYGDQALFMKAELFHRIKGFPNLPIMEDYELVRRLRRHGRVRIIPFPAITSARRWKRAGVWKTTIIHQLIILGYMAGAAPEFLARVRERLEGERERGREEERDAGGTFSR